MKKIKSGKEDFLLVALGDKVFLFFFSHWVFFPSRTERYDAIPETACENENKTRDPTKVTTP